MNGDQAFLDFLHRTASMDVNTLPQVMGLPQSRAKVPALQAQLRECRSVAALAQSYAKARGGRLRGPGTAALTLTAASLRTRSLLDSSTSHLAEQVIRENTAGAVALTRQLHQCTSRTDPTLMELGRRLLAAKEQNIQEMKRFL